MSRKRPDREDLSDREREILQSVIRAHIVTGEPVGSRTLSRATRLDLSPATIRNIMADLEDRGLLAQPHTSAGRVPTDAAYRLYVDRLMGRPRMSPTQARAIDEALLGGHREIPDLLEAASKQLSRLSKNVGVVLAPEVRRIVVEHLEFVRLTPRRVVAVLVSRSGVVHNRILELEEPLSQEDLDRIGRHLSEQFAGRTLPEMRAELLRRISQERHAYDELVDRALRLGRQAVDEPEAGTEVFIEGASNLVGVPDFADLEKMRALLRTLEEKTRLVELLSRVLEDEGVQVVIGEENPVEDLASCAVVASTYRARDRVLGTVGIVGPKRMEYARAIALVDHLAQVLTRVLSDDESSPPEGQSGRGARR